MADYNINAVTRRVVFTGSAGLGPYAFTFEVLNADDVAVYFNATLLTVTTDYTVTINANGTGSVTIVTGGSVPSTPTASDQIVIVGARDIERVTDFVTAGDLLASSLNEQLDSLTIFDQQVAEENRRAMRAPVYDPALVEDGGVVDMTLPAKASRAGKTLAFDSNGNPTVGEDIGNWRGDWAAGTAYTVRDLVKDPVNESIYRVNTAHTSSGSAPISTNADAAKFDLVIDATAVADAEAAQAAAEAAQAAAETAETNAASSASSASSSASSAATSATNAATSATAAASSASAASTSATNAATSETNAATSASAASTSATNAATSASGAATSATNAATSATAAAGSASAASTSETNAAASASAASTSATNAATSETNAATSETNAATSATNAATSASAAAASQTAAATSAAAAASAFDNFDDTYLGSKTADPTVDNDGDPLTQGDLYFNSTANEMRVYDGANWIPASSAGGVSLILYEYTATSGQTTFSGADDNAATLSYTADNIQVFMNGVNLDPSDYTATNGTSVVLATGAAANDIVNIYAFKSFTVADTVSASAGGTFSGNVTVNALLNVDNIRLDGNTISSTDTNGNITLDPDGTGDVIVASGNVGIGTASPNSHLTTQTSSTSTSAFDFGLQVNNSGGFNDSIAAIGFHNRADVNGTGVGGAIAYVGGGASGGSGNITFNIKDNTDISNVVDVADEKMRIDSSGNVLVGTTTSRTGSDSLSFEAGNSLIWFQKNGTATQSQVIFQRDTTGSPTIVGSIQTSGSSTSYNTSSDHRLKEAVVDMTGAIDRVKALAPKRFNFIADADTTVDGFLAHEAQAIVPEAVTGTHNEVDDDGNAVMQGIDQSKLVPLLTGALQEAIAKIEALETRIEALETAS